MKNFGFTRVAAITPRVKVADVEYNVSEICRLVLEAEEKKASIVVFPELSVTGYTCGDLFGNNLLIEGAEDGISRIRKFSRGKEAAIVVGAPVRCHHKLYNSAVVIRNGEIRGIVPKLYPPSYNEFYESRWFASGADFLSPTMQGGDIIGYAGQNSVNMSPNMLFRIGEATFAIEICEDLWTPIPPSSFHSVAGADIIVNLSASNEVLMKHVYRKNLVCEQSAHTLSGYIYCSAGYGESTQDLVYSGPSLVYENGTLLAELPRFSRESGTIYADVDVEKLSVLRRKQSSFCYFTPDGTGAAAYARLYTRVDLGDGPSTDFSAEFFRHVEAHPFAPENDTLEIDSRCREITSIQVTGLMTRLEHISARTAVIGISGGLDSTLALLVTVMAFDRLGWSRDRIIGVTMPGLGTSGRTKGNAVELMKILGITMREVPVIKAVEQHFSDIGHDPSVKDTTYENAQARERTQILMDIANQTGGMVVGTGDLSELALGWCTYNGDHMSMYGVNASVPKTLVRSLCKWAATNVFAEAGKVLLDIVDTPISPELTPADEEGNIAQLTEDLVGPYELHDFFLYHFFRFGSSPEKILFLAEKAFGGSYEKETLEKWLKKFVWRFFGSQFKRSCLPDGPKVGSVSLSPRGDWRMPSDAHADLFIASLGRERKG